MEIAFVGHDIADRHLASTSRGDCGEVSCTTGQGLDPWLDWLKQRRAMALSTVGVLVQ